MGTETTEDASGPLAITILADMTQPYPALYLRAGYYNDETSAIIVTGFYFGKGGRKCWAD